MITIYVQIGNIGIFKRTSDNKIKTLKLLKFRGLIVYVIFNAWRFLFHIFKIVNYIIKIMTVYIGSNVGRKSYKTQDKYSKTIHFYYSSQGW